MRPPARTGARRPSGGPVAHTETIFVSGRMVLAAARALVAQDPPLFLSAEAYAYDCPRCGSDEVRIAVLASYDPLDSAALAAKA